MGSDKKKAYDAIGMDDNFLRLDPHRVVLIGRDTAHRSRDEHLLYDERVHWTPNRRIIDSMKANGWDKTRPATVRLNGRRPDGSAIVEVHTGRRRTIAFRVANDELVKEGKPPWPMLAIAVTGEDAEIYGSMTRENEFRVDDNPVLKARKMAHALKLGRTFEQVALDFNTTPITVERHVALLEGDPVLVNAIARLQVPMEMARKLLPLPREEQRAAVEKLLAAKGQGATGAAMNMMAEAAVGPVRGRKRASRGKVKGRRAVELFESNLKTDIGDRPPSKEQKILLAALQWFQGDEDALVEYDYAREALKPRKKGRKPGKKGAPRSTRRAA